MSEISVPEWLTELDKLENVPEDEEFLTVTELSRIWGVSHGTASDRIGGYQHNPKFRVEIKRIRSTTTRGHKVFTTGYKITPVLTARTLRKT